MFCWVSKGTKNLEDKSLAHPLGLSSQFSNPNRVFFSRCQQKDRRSSNRLTQTKWIEDSTVQIIDWFDEDWLNWWLNQPVHPRKKLQLLSGQKTVPRTGLLKPGLRIELLDCLILFRFVAWNLKTYQINEVQYTQLNEITHLCK